MKSGIHKIPIHGHGEVADITISNIDPSIFYVVTLSLDVLKINVESKAVEKVVRLSAPKLIGQKHFSIYLSPADQYIGLVNTRGQFGVVYDLEKDEIVLHLDRGSYRFNNSRFPISFFTDGKLTYLASSSDWNKLEIFDLDSRKLVTNRPSLDYKEQGYLDYFYGELHLAPNQRTLLSSGWVWGPGSYIRFIDLKSWLDGNVYESEKRQEANIFVMSYYWDRAICWLDNNEIAYLYDPKEESLDEEDCQEMMVDLNASYIIIYDIQTAKIKHRILCDVFPKDEYFEAHPDVKLFFDQKFIVSSKSRGTSFIEVKSGKVYQTFPEYYFNKYDHRSRQLYACQNSILNLMTITY